MSIEISMASIISFGVLIVIGAVLVWLYFSKRGQQAVDDAFDKTDAVGAFVDKVEEELPKVVEAVKAKVKK